MSDRALDQKLDRMKEIIRSLKSVAVAFSAGVDSTFVLRVAIDCLGRENAVAVTSNSDSLARAEFEETVDLTERLGAEHVVIETDEFENPDYLANPADRCYHCKTSLYEHLDRFIKERGLNAIINGINADDLGDWRPGIQAAGEHQVRAPAAEAGLTKEDIRILSKRMGLPTYDKPAAPCLSSRVQYGESITPEKLRMIESCEAFLHRMGIRECRVRHHDNLARIEVPPEHIAVITAPQTRARIDEHFRSVGYQYVVVDLRGFRSGSMNEVIAFGRHQR
ncbi:MAG: ATP-dependent sacrificial sulfur transferase LarE [Phycisphaerae bacterium]